LYHRQRIVLEKNIVRTPLYRSLNPHFAWTIDGVTYPYTIIDSLNWVQAKLSAWSKSLGKDFNKHKMPEVTYEENPIAWQLYCKQDVIALEHCVKNYLESLFKLAGGYFEIGLTTSSNAMRLFRLTYMSEKSIGVSTNERQVEIEKKSYHGGHVEAYYDGQYDGPLVKLDINSLYPSVMQNTSMPVRYYRSIKGDVNMLMGFIDDEQYVVLADIVVDIPEDNEIPPLPFHSDKLIFPNGQFRGFYWQSEIKLIPSSMIKAVKRIYLYHARKDVFDYYIETLGEIKKTTKDSVLRNTTKLMLNGLYGKFGQKKIPNHWNDAPSYFQEYLELPKGIVICDGPCCVDKDKDDPTRQLALLRTGGKTYALHKPLSQHFKKNFNSNIAIAAYITSRARAVLMETIQYLHSQGERTLYCDTDSLMVRQSAVDILSDRIDDTEFGYWKIEGYANSAVILGPKSYIFGDKVTLKGANKDTLIANEGGFTSTRSQPIKAQTRLYQGISTEGQHWIDRTHSIKQLNSKRESVKNGWNKPITLLRESL